MMMWHDRSAWLRIRLAQVLRAVVPPRLVRRYRERESFRRNVHRAASWAWLPLLVYSFLFTDSGLVSIVCRHVRIRTLQHELAGAETQANRLEAESDRRTDDATTIERLARERYDMAYPGERVYRIVEISPGQARRIAHAQREIEKKKDAEEKAAEPPPAPKPAAPQRQRRPAPGNDDQNVATRRHR
jgi:cell division protein FtsB